MLINFFFSYIFIVCSILGYGFLICSFVNKNYIENNIGYIGLIGIFFLTIYSYFTSLFVAHTPYHNFFFLGVGMIAFLFHTIYLKKLPKDDFFIFIIIFLIILLGLFIYKTHDDFSYYHFQYSYYLTQYSKVIGIGNFGLGLRTSSSLFYLNSLFYLPVIEYFTFQITAALILGFANLILLIKLKNNLLKNRNNFLLIYNLLVFAFINIFFYRLAEHGTDKSAQILIFILFSEILLFINFKIHSIKSISRIFVLISLIISFKAFYLLYGIYFFIIIYHLFALGNSIKKIFNILINNPFFLGFVVLSILIFLHNFLISGCLVYPVHQTCFENHIWSIKIDEVKNLNNWYEQWSKGGAGPNFRVDEPLLYIKNFNWVPNWINVYFLNKVSDYLIGLIFLIFIFFIIFRFQSKLIMNKKTIKKNFFIILTLILIFEWFYNHPALRYGGYCLISSIIFIYFSIYLEKYKLKNFIFTKRVYLIIALVFGIFISRNVNRINNEINIYEYKPLKVFAFHIDKKVFNLTNNLSSLINAYNLCDNSDQNCKLNKNNKIFVDKLNGMYVFYLK